MESEVTILKARIDVLEKQLKDAHDIANELTAKNKELEHTSEALKALNSSAKELHVKAEATIDNYQRALSKTVSAAHKLADQAAEKVLEPIYDEIDNADYVNLLKEAGEVPYEFEWNWIISALINN